MTQVAALYRGFSASHICPFGLKAKYLLKKHGYQVDDRILSTPDEVDAFKKAHDVKTTPQIFIGEKRIGGYDDLRAYLGLSPEKTSGVTYAPLYAIFIMTLLLALATLRLTHDQTLFGFFRNFISLSMCVLAVLKLKDLSSFSNGFLGYDLLARHYVPYAYVYPFLEGVAGVLMYAMFIPVVASVIAIMIGGIGSVSVLKAVYIDKRTLKCACVGGNSSVPLGAISMTENVMMVVMGIWMLVQHLL